MLGEVSKHESSTGIEKAPEKGAAVEKAPLLEQQKPAFEQKVGNGQSGKIAPVVEAMGAHLCAEHPNTEVRISIDCTYIDREQRTYGGYNICNVPEL